MVNIKLLTFYSETGYNADIQQYSHGRLLMLKHVIPAALMVAVMSLPAAARTGNTAGDHFSKGCLKPITGFRTKFQAGLTTMPEKMTEVALRKAITDYGNLIRATAQSQACFKSALALAKASRQASRVGQVSPRIAQLQRGVNEVGRIFRLGHQQFKAAFDNGSARLLSGLTPAAGPGTAASNKKSATADWIDSGEALLLNSEKITLKQSELQFLARQSHQ